MGYRQKATAASYDYAIVQKKVNALMNRKSVDQVAREVLVKLSGVPGEMVMIVLIDCVKLGIPQSNSTTRESITLTFACGLRSAGFLLFLW